MEMGIHDLLFIGILLTQPNVIKQFPIGRKRLNVASLLRIKTMLLDPTSNKSMAQ